MLLKITKCTDKSNDWKIVDVETPTGEKTVDVSVNRVNKKGEAFPAFDDIKVDHRLNATLWVSPSGKAYLFESKPENAPRGNFGGSKTSLADKTALEDHKNQNIKENMKWKAEGQAYGNSVTNATNIVIELMRNFPMTLSEALEKVKTTRDWYLEESRKYQQEDPTDKTPF